jgi:hypothetical protein
MPAGILESGSDITKASLTEKQTRCRGFSYGSGFAKTLVCDSCLLSRRFKLPDHNLERAAPMPVMMGMMVCAVDVLCSLEAHKYCLLF